MRTHAENDAPPVLREDVLVPHIVLDQDAVERPRQDEQAVDDQVENSAASVDRRGRSKTLYYHIEKKKQRTW